MKTFCFNWKPNAEEGKGITKVAHEREKQKRISCQICNWSCLCSPATILCSINQKISKEWNTKRNRISLLLTVIRNSATITEGEGEEKNGFGFCQKEFPFSFFYVFSAQLPSNQYHRLIPFDRESLKGEENLWP